MNEDAKWVNLLQENVYRQMKDEKILDVLSEQITEADYPVYIFLLVITVIVFLLVYFSDFK